MIAKETSVTTEGRRVSYGTSDDSRARTERPCACSDFDILHGLCDLLNIGGRSSQTARRAGQTFPKASMALRPPKRPFVGIFYRREGGKKRDTWPNRMTRAIVTRSYPRPASPCPANCALPLGSHPPVSHSTPRSSDTLPSPLPRPDSDSRPQG
jgi:hypothetical protein